MGDMADYALDGMMDDDEEQQRLADVDFRDLTDAEREFMYDEYGVRYPSVFGRRSIPSKLDLQNELKRIFSPHPRN